MGRLLRTPQAAEDLIDIYAYIAQRNPRAAEKLLLALGQQLERLAEHPGIGRARPDLRPELRSWPHKDYIVLYRTIDRGVEVVRVAL